MKIEFTTIGGTRFESNESQTYFYATWTDGQGNRKTRRIKKAEFFSAQHENEIERKAIAEAEAAELDTTAETMEVTEEDIERDARELERYIEEAEESNTDLEVAEIAEQMLDAAAEDPEVSLEEYVEKVEKVEKAKKARKSKDIEFTYTVNGEVIVTLTAKQVDFIKHLPDTCFWQDGLDSCIWIDCLCDEIKGQFAGKPMTVGAMISTICEKRLGIRADNRVNGKKCKSFALTELGKQVFANPEWGLINAYTDFITHKVPQGKPEVRDEGKFMTVTFHPGLMNAILQSMAAIGIAA